MVSPAAAPSPSAASGPHARLAAQAGHVFRWGVSNELPVNPPAFRARARERLYVVCQLGGWLALMGLQMLLQMSYVRVFWGRAQSLVSYAAIAQVCLLGLMITHFSRSWIHRWEWKELGWKPLAPRVIALAAAQALLLLVCSYVLYYGLLQMPWKSKYPQPLMFVTSWINATVIFGGWLCTYFFYHLSDRFNRLEVEGLRLVSSAKEAELRALKSQVNPHFLFNSLNSLRALIDEDPQRAREAVTRMANLLRYSLQSGQLETVSLDDELHTVEDYLSLEQIRHEDRLRVRFDVEPETRSLPVPPMLLQTLVENAVKYGINPRREGGEIVVTARCGRGALRLCVTNPGELAPRSGSTGLGLKNAAERLQLLFGARASLDLRVAAPGLVAAEIAIPLPDRPS